MVRVRGLFNMACFVASVAMFAPTTLGEDLKDGKQILEKSREALMKVKVASYEARYLGTGAAKDWVPQVDGRVIVGSTAEFDVPRFFCDVSIRKTGSEESKKYTAGCDGNEYYLLDAAAKKAHYDIDPVVLGSDSRNIQRVLVREFGGKNPLDAELKSETIELKGTASVEGEDCYEVYVAIKNSSQKATVWHIGKKDFLPRKLQRVYPPRDGATEDGITELVIHKLVLDPKTDKDPFKLVVPEGYQATDEFAP
ncbi:MAG: hypothetical protein AABZ12_11635 [Planctomycetota bacterium]